MTEISTIEPSTEQVLKTEKSRKSKPKLLSEHPLHRLPLIPKVSPTSKNTTTSNQKKSTTDRKSGQSDFLKAWLSKSENVPPLQDINIANSDIEKKEDDVSDDKSGLKNSTPSSPSITSHQLTNEQDMMHQTNSDISEKSENISSTSRNLKDIPHQSPSKTNSNNGNEINDEDKLTVSDTQSSPKEQTTNSSNEKVANPTSSSKSVTPTLKNWFTGTVKPENKVFSIFANNNNTSTVSKKDVDNKINDLNLIWYPF